MIRLVGFSAVTVGSPRPSFLLPYALAAAFVLKRLRIELASPFERIGPHLLPLTPTDLQGDHQAVLSVPVDVAPANGQASAAPDRARPEWRPRGAIQRGRAVDLPIDQTDLAIARRLVERPQVRHAPEGANEVAFCLFLIDPVWIEKAVSVEFPSPLD